LLWCEFVNWIQPMSIGMRLGWLILRQPFVIHEWELVRLIDWSTVPCFNRIWVI
jgi:hypothetical protein